MEWGDEHGDWNGGKEKDKERGRVFEGAKECVEGLLKKAGRGRWTEEMVREHRWVREGICVSGGLVSEGAMVEEGVGSG